MPKHQSRTFSVSAGCRAGVKSQEAGPLRRETRRRRCAVEARTLERPLPRGERGCAILMLLFRRGGEGNLCWSMLPCCRVFKHAAEAETEGACSGASACAMLLAAAVGACWQGGSF
jgi:hypothetical protein